MPSAQRLDQHPGSCTAVGARRAPRPSDNPSAEQAALGLPGERDDMQELTATVPVKGPQPAEERSIADRVREDSVSRRYSRPGDRREIWGPPPQRSPLRPPPRKRLSRSSSSSSSSGSGSSSSSSDLNCDRSRDGALQSALQRPARGHALPLPIAHSRRRQRESSSGRDRDVRRRRSTSRSRGQDSEARGYSADHDRVAARSRGKGTRRDAPTGSRSHALNDSRVQVRS